MSAIHVAILGAIAGFTIYLGLPIGRMRNTAPKMRALLNALAAGILIFILWDVLAHAWEPIDDALGHDVGFAVGNGLVLAAGLIIGLLGLVYFDRWIARRTARAGLAAPSTGTGPSRDAGASEVAAGGVVTSTAALPGSVAAGSSVATATGSSVATATGSSVALAVAEVPKRSAAWHLALMIAIGIGLHNFAEGLAIGSSAAAGELSLAILLVIGFGLHNATEGFGIVAPLAAAGERPSWGYLGALGLIGGGPTLIGTLVGQRFTNTTLSIAFLALAAGSILYVVIELLAVGRRFNFKEITTWGIVIGLIAGFLTDAIVTAAGA